MRRFFCDNAQMWLRDFHIDGLRIDAVHSFVDRSAIHFLEQLAMEVETLGATLGRSLVLIAESDLNDPRIVTPRDCGGFGMDAQWSDDFHHALFAVLSRETARRILQRFRISCSTCQGDRRRRSSTMEYFPAIAIESTAARRGISPSIVFSVSSRITIRSETGRSATESAKLQGSIARRLRQPWYCLAPLFRCCFRVRNGRRFRHSNTLPITKDRGTGSPGFGRAAGESFVAFGWDPATIPDPERRATFERRS